MIIRLLLLLSLSIGLCRCETVRIHNANELVELSERVNSGEANYSGTTVFLENDVNDFCGKVFEPIGKNLTIYFDGVFDGQGYTISNLAINSSGEYVGLFGYSKDATIRNVVMDGSCSVATSYGSGGGSMHVGGLVGSCLPEKDTLVLENCVNLAPVSFVGTSAAASFLYAGGIVGAINSYTNAPTMKNCANYGSVSRNEHSGNTYIGGIVGVCGSSSSKIRIQNCLNHGTLFCGATGGGVTNVGGIIGYGYDAILENCVSAGKIELSGPSAKVGGIIGNLASVVEMVNSFWTGETGYADACGSGDPALTESGYAPTLNSTILNGLNSYSVERGWNKWLLNTNSVEVAFKANGGNGFSTTAKLILLPEPAGSENNTFSDWFADDACESPFDLSSTFDGITLYGGWKYNVTLVYKNGTEQQRSVAYGLRYGQLPSESREGFAYGWFTETDGNGARITPETLVAGKGDHTLYAHWNADQYTITFDFGNGTAIKKEYAFNETVSYPEGTPERRWYVFRGWSDNITVMPSRDVTVNAVWDEIIVSSQVEIVFGRKVLTEDEARTIIKEFTDDAYTIVRLSFDEKADETIVIIEFTDPEKANDFVRSVDKSMGSSSSVKRAKTIKEVERSFSCVLYPVALGILFILQ